MLQRMILPLADILDSYMQYDAIFCFYEGGIRGLIKDAVYESSLRDESSELRAHYRQYRNVDPLVEYALDKFFDNLELVSRSNAVYAELSRDNEMVIRFVTEAIVLDIWEVMRVFVGPVEYTVVDHSLKWFHRDMLATLILQVPSRETSWSFEPLDYRPI